MVQTFHDKHQSIRMEPVRRRNKILLVDNEADVIITFKAILQEAGFIVNTYEDPLIALSNFIPHFYDLVILDELNNALAIDKFLIEDVLPLNEVIDMIQSRPEHMHLIITGRSAKEEIIAEADLVTEMKEVKHYYHEGIPAVKGIEF